MEKIIQNIFQDSKNIPDEFKLETKVDQTEYLINGEIRNWKGEVVEVYSPIYLKTSEGVEQQCIGSYPMFTEKEAYEALSSAVDAYDNGKGVWPTMSVENRISCVVDFVNRMVETRDEVVKLLMWEIGKTLKDSEKEFDRTVQYIKDTIDALKDLDRTSSRFISEEGVIGQIRRSPYGVALCMGPFNYPINETLTTLIPALIMGNAVIFKPPRQGVLPHYPLLDAFHKSFPKGVVNTLYGDGETIIEPIMKSGKVNVLAFIGSSNIAGRLKNLHSKPHRLKSVLGLEAKNAGIVLPDADMELTVSEAVSGTLSFNGQRCTALKVLFVHKDVVDQFIEKFTEKIENLKIGMPWDNVNITPLPEPNKSEYLSNLVINAQENGAKVMNKSGGMNNRSFFFPTVLYPVSSKMDIYHEEQFGPVIPIIPFSDLQEALDYVENSNFGQQVSIFGKDPKTIAKLVDPLVNQVCRVNINSQCQRGPDTFPFTGRKDSAEATLSVTDAMRVFSIRTLVATKDNDLNKEIFSTIVKNRDSNFLSTDYIF